MSGNAACWTSCSCLTHTMQSSCPVQDLPFLCQAIVPQWGKQRELVCTELSGEDGHQAELQCRVTSAMLGTSSPAMTQKRTKKSKRAFQSAKPGRCRWVDGVQQPRAGESCRDLSVLYSSQRFGVHYHLWVLVGPKPLLSLP